LTPSLPFPAAPRRGRPRKFGQPSRAVTLTLPEGIIKALEGVDRDLSRAIVRVAQPEMAKRPHPAAELASFGRFAVIVVTPTKTLEKRTGVLLVPLSDGRALIAFDESMTAARLELKIQDELDDHDLPEDDARVFEGIRDLLKDARRSSVVELKLRNIMVLESLAGKAKGRRAKRIRTGQ
jgi:hypothetical protein